MNYRRHLVRLAAQHGFTLAPNWSGVDAVLPILDQIRKDGAVVLIKMDGERTAPGDSGQYTCLISGMALDTDFIRADTETLEDGLARILCAYLERLSS